MTRRTVEAIVQVTYEEGPDTPEYTSRTFAADIRDGVFQVINEEAREIPVIMSVTGGEEQERAFKNGMRVVDWVQPIPATDHASLQED